MPPPSTLPDPRHEAFAVHLARGQFPAAAYVLAGFPNSNTRALSAELAQHPDIAARVQHLRDCLPHTQAMLDRYAPSLLLMPETRDEILAWLWQVMNGTRKILPLQLRAATLFTRLKGWHLQKSGPHSPLCGLDQSGPHAGPTAEGNPQCAQKRGPHSPLCGLGSPDAKDREQPPVRPDLTESEKTLIARQNHANILADTQLRAPNYTDVAAFHSQMADHAVVAAIQFPQTRPNPALTRILKENPGFLSASTPPASTPQPSAPPASASATSASATSATSASTPPTANPQPSAISDPPPPVSSSPSPPIPSAVTRTGLKWFEPLRTG